MSKIRTIRALAGACALAGCLATLALAQSAATPAAPAPAPAVQPASPAAPAPAPAPAVRLAPAPGAPTVPAAPAPGAVVPKADPDRIGPPAIDAMPTAPPMGYTPPAGMTPSTSGRRANFQPYIPPKDYVPPQIFLPEPRFDWGTVIKGEVVTHTFPIENKGGSALVVQRVRPSCGCTLVNENMEKVIAPGGKGSFELKIETSRLIPGQQSKYADVSTNDPKQPQTRVFIAGKIESILKIEPENPKIETIRGKGQGSTEITLTKNVQGDVKIHGAKSQSGRLLVDLKEVQPGAIWKVAVKTNYGPKDTQSYFGETLQFDVQFGERRMPQDQNLTVLVKDRIELNPRVVTFRKADFDSLQQKQLPAKRTINVKTLLPEPYKFKIANTKLDNPDNWFSMKVEPVVEGREYRLEVNIDKMPSLTKDQKSLKGNITIVTDDPEMAEISIRCLAFF